VAKFGRDVDGEVGRQGVAKLAERCVAKFGRKWLAKLVVALCG
jgi:hypothetical protein